MSTSVGFTMAEIAAFPAVYLTAFYAAFEMANAKRGQTALVHSAAGGVGLALCRLLSNLGVTVVGVVGSSHKVTTAKLGGATHVIDKSREDIWKRCDELAPNGFDRFVQTRDCCFFFAFKKM